MTDDAALANHAGAAFVFRTPCPSCDFTIGVRSADVDAGRVSCPVCSAVSTITSETPRGGSPFRESVATRALVPVEPRPVRRKPTRTSRWVQIRSETVRPSDRLYRVTRTNPGRRLLPFVWVVFCLVAMLLIATVSGAAVALAALAFGFATYVMGARWAESATLEGDELTLTTETPFELERVFRLDDATVEVEQVGTSDGVVTIRRHGASIVLGDIGRMSFIAAETLAERLRKHIGRGDG
jgi:hypothetical protein